MKFCTRCGEYSDDAIDRCKRCGRSPLTPSAGQVSASSWRKTFALFHRTQKPAKQPKPQETPPDKIPALILVERISAETAQMAEYRALRNFTTVCFVIYLLGIEVGTRLEYGQFSFAILVIWPLLLLFPELLTLLERKESAGLTLALTTSLVGIGAAVLWLGAQLLLRAVSGPPMDPIAIVYVCGFGLVHMRLLTLAKGSMQSRSMVGAYRSGLVITGIISTIIVFLILGAFSQAL